MKPRAINLLEEAQKPGGSLDGFGPSRWVPAPSTLQALIEATGGAYNPNDVFFGGSFEDRIVYHPERRQWALCADWIVAIAEDQSCPYRRSKEDPEVPPCASCRRG